MLARVYTVAFENVAVAAAQDFFEVTPGDDKPVAFIGLTVDNVGGTADAGDAQEEDLRLAVIRGHTTSGSGGTAPTPVPMSPADSAAGFTAEVNNTTIASVGTTTTVWAFGWNTRMGLREFLAEEYWPRASQANTTMVVRLLSTPADSFQVSGTLWVAEFV